MAPVKQSNILDPIHDVLNPKIWSDPGSPEPKLKPQLLSWIKDHVYSVAKDFAPNPERWAKLILTGSITTYQYGNDSDVDISVFIDPNAMPEWDRAKLIGLMVSRLDGTKVAGTNYPIQCFVVSSKIKPEDLYQEGLRSGYDLDTNDWIIPPDKSRNHDVESEYNAYYVYALQSADKMERLLSYEPKKAIQFWHHLHVRRQRDQRSGKGDFSESNIVYKMLSQRGLFPKISQVSGEYIA